MSKLWNWIAGLFGKKVVSNVTETETGKEMNMNTVANEVPVTVAAAAIKASKVKKAEAPKHRRMNRKMRRFLLSMGRDNGQGKILAPRGTTKELWSAFNSLMVSKEFGKCQKRGLFVKSFGL